MAVSPLHAVGSALRRLSRLGLRSDMPILRQNSLILINQLCLLDLLFAAVANAGLVASGQSDMAFVSGPFGLLSNGSGLALSGGILLLNARGLTGPGRVLFAFGLPIRLLLLTEFGLAGGYITSDLAYTFARSQLLVLLVVRMLVFGFESRRRLATTALLSVGLMVLHDGWASALGAPDLVDDGSLPLGSFYAGSASEIVYIALGVFRLRRLTLAYEEGLSEANSRLRQEVEERRAAEEGLRRSNRSLSALYDVTATTSQRLELHPMLERVLDTVLEISSGRAATVHLQEEEEGRLVPVARRGAIEVAEEAEAVAQWEGMLARAFAMDQMVVGVQARDPGEGVATAAPGLTAACVALPLHARGRALGVLTVFGGAKEQFSLEALALLAAVADHLGAAVETLRLWRQAERAAVVEERQRLARELHDSVNQLLYSQALYAEAGQDALLAGQPTRAGEYLGRLGATAGQALREMRLLIYQLRPDALAQLGLAGALRQRLEAVEGRAGMRARVLVEETVDLPPALEAALFGVAQEALNNALKHSGATAVTVRLDTSEERVRLEVADDGRGFDVAAGYPRGLGLASMAERVRELGGTLAIDSRPGEGTTVRATVPRGWPEEVA